MAMNSTKVRLVVTNLYPFYLINQDGGEITMRGILSFLWGFFKHIFKGRYETLVSSNYGLGIESDPGNWTGVMGHLQRNEADVFVGHYAIDYHAAKFVDFSTAFDAITLSVLSGPPVREGQVPGNVFSSIEEATLKYLTISWIVVSTAFWFISTFHRLRISSGEVPVSWIQCLISFFGVLNLKALELKTTFSSLRIITASCFILVIVVMVTVSGDFASKLAITNKPERIDRLEDILNWPELKPYVFKGSIADSYLKQAQKNKENKLSAIWDLILKHGGHVGSQPWDTVRYIMNVIAGNAVVIGIREPALNCIANDFCKASRDKFFNKFYIARENFLSLPVAFAYRKGLDKELVETINVRALEHGGAGFGALTWRLTKQYSGPCLDVPPEPIKPQTMEIHEVKQVFVFLRNGLLLATGAFILEWSIAMLKHLHKCCYG